MRRRKHTRRHAGPRDGLKVGPALTPRNNRLSSGRAMKLGKTGSKFRHGGRGNQKWPKQLRRFLWTTPNAELGIETGLYGQFELILHSFQWLQFIQFVPE